MLHDKKLMIGVGLAAALGAGVLWQRKKSTGSTTSADPTAAQQGAPAGYVGGFNSTGTDVASWLGNYSGSLQTQLDQYQKQLTTALQGAGQIGVPATGAITTNDQWAQAAFSWMATNNKWKTTTPIMSQKAISDYLGGKFPDVPPWEQWTINEILSGNRGSVHEGTGLGPPPQLPG